MNKNFWKSLTIFCFSIWIAGTWINSSEELIVNLVISLVGLGITVRIFKSINTWKEPNSEVSDE